jgi:hypothetical protein
MMISSNYAILFTHHFAGAFHRARTNLTVAEQSGDEFARLDFLDFVAVKFVANTSAAFTAYELGNTLVSGSSSNTDLADRAFTAVVFGFSVVVVEHFL